MESLVEIYKRHATEGDCGHGDKGSVHSYIPSYERLLAPYRAGGALLEIGLASGKSLDMWSDYFGPYAQLFGVDLSLTFDTARFGERIRVIAADATQSSILAVLGDARFDIIIDDGSHMQGDQEATFRLLSPLMNPGGLYIIEDILNLEMCREALLALHPACDIIDLRPVKGRFDDVLVVYRF